MMMNITAAFCNKMGSPRQSKPYSLSSISHRASSDPASMPAFPCPGHGFDPFGCGEFCTTSHWFAVNGKLSTRSLGPRPGSNYGEWRGRNGWLAPTLSILLVGRTPRPSILPLHPPHLSPPQAAPTLCWRAGCPMTREPGCWAAPAGATAATSSPGCGAGGLHRRLKAVQLSIDRPTGCDCYACL